MWLTTKQSKASKAKQRCVMGVGSTSMPSLCKRKIQQCRLSQCTTGRYSRICYTLCLYSCVSLLANSKHGSWFFKARIFIFQARPCLQARFLGPVGDCSTQCRTRNRVRQTLVLVQTFSQLRSAVSEELRPRQTERQTNKQTVNLISFITIEDMIT